MPPMQFMTTLYNSGEKKRKALTAPLWVALHCLPLLLQATVSSRSKQHSLKLKSISRYWFSSVCEQLSVLVRVSRSGLQTTVHILCPAVRLPGNVSCWMKAVPMALFLPRAALSISFCLATPHLSSQLASPLLHTNRWTKRLITNQGCQTDY